MVPSPSLLWSKTQFSAPGLDRQILIADEDILAVERQMDDILLMDFCQNTGSIETDC
jgi:hypothetical protein